MLSGRAPAYVPHKRDTETFPLRGLILCAECGKAVTASKSTSKSGRKFGYYHCTGAGHLYVKAEVIEVDFVALLERLAPSPDRSALIVRLFVDVWESKLANAASESTALRQELGRLARKPKDRHWSN